MSKILRAMLLPFCLLSVPITGRAQDLLKVPCTYPSPDTVAYVTAIRTTNRKTDTIEVAIRKQHNVFRPCRMLTYRALYRSRQGDLISDEKISMMATGRPWEYAPEDQSELIIEYKEQSESERKNLEPYNINKKLPIRWNPQSVTGVIERDNWVWMHPFRGNQYQFTETAPFPQVYLPLSIGGKYNGGRLKIGEGWGAWKGTTWRRRYKVTGNSTREYGSERMENCWRIEARSRNFRFGTSKLIFWYHEEYGFVEMFYTNYKKQTLHLKLERVENH